MQITPICNHIVRLALIFAVLKITPGCTSTAGRGLTVVWQQRAHTLNTEQPCLSEPLVLERGDAALVALLRAASAAKLVPSYEAGAARLSRVGVCLVQRPEPCRIGSLCTLDHEGRPDCSPKAGCATDGAAWTSAEWPAGAPRDWCADLVHELGNAIAARVTDWQVASAYDPRWRPVVAAATLGVCNGR